MNKGRFYFWYLHAFSFIKAQTKLNFWGIYLCDTHIAVSHNNVWSCKTFTIWLKKIKEKKIVDCNSRHLLPWGQKKSQHFCRVIFFQGDSGGPLTVTNSLERHVLAGATSWGYGCATVSTGRGRARRPVQKSRLCIVPFWNPLHRELLSLGKRA